MEEFEKLKKNRAVLRRATTKLTNDINEIIKSDIIDFENLEELINQLDIKHEELKVIDDKIDPFIKLVDYDVEINTIQEYRDKITLSLFRGRKKISEENNKKIFENSKSNNSEKTLTHAPQAFHSESKFVKLPKLSIPKYFGQSTQYLNFWNTFKVSIDDNENLSKIQKFCFLKSFLGGIALAAIEGLEITDDNYDAALKILQERFGSKELIIQEHFNKLLNLSPVYKITDISKLRKLHDEVEINVRSLSSLGVKPDTYSNMLTTIILKSIPSSLSLEFNRQYSDTSSSDIFELLKFIQKEIKARERSFLDRSLPPKELNPPKKPPWKEFRPGPSTQEFVAVAEEKKSFPKKCIFCNSFHSSSLCNTLSVEKKREILKSHGRCFLCLNLKHCIRDCKFKHLVCKMCKGKHNENICFRANTSHVEQGNEKIESATKNDSDQEIVTAISHNKNETTRILLQTGCAKIKNRNTELLTRLLFDTGSMRTFLRKNIADKLKLKVIRKEKLSVFTFGSKTPIEKSYDVVSVTLVHRHSPNSKIRIEALVTNEITGSNIPPPELKEVIKNEKIRNLTLADSPDCKEPVSILVGADYYYNLITGKIIRVNKNLVAVESIFGWCLQSQKYGNDITLNMSVIVEENLISDHIKKFYDLEASGLVDEKKDLDPSENEILKQFESNIKYRNQRYEVRLPWKSEVRNLNDNRKIAESRFTRLRKRFLKNPDLFLKYQEILHDYLKEGIIELAPNSDCDSQNVTFYLPHREVIRKDRSSSQLRIVFDGSSHDATSVSLNSCLHIGPNLYPEIFDILLRFRLDEVAFTADMKQAFLQIMLNEQDRDVTRFLFTEDPSDESQPPSIYRFTRVLFGISSSPFLLGATIKYHLKKYLEKYAQTVEFLNENIYVDDIIGSKSSVDQALNISLETIKIFEDAGISLHKWKTNSKSLHKAWKENGITLDENSSCDTFDKQPFKVLGIAWNNEKDLLYFDIKGLIDFVSKRIDTKRFILQVLGRIFDPIGFLGPFTLQIKYLMQKIWSLGVDWDESLPDDIISMWSNWCADVSQLTAFSVPRYYFSDSLVQKFETLELHLFSDACEKSYGTVAYLRLTSNESVHTSFVASKNRIAPLKKLTLPRLELMGALLSARLSTNILKALKLKIRCYFWTDSSITYFWIKGVPEKFKPFIKNRVQEIQNLTCPSSWYHCPGTQNPADIVSRGAKISKLINDPMWLQGPAWLKMPKQFWPKHENVNKIDSSELEYRKSNVVQHECIVEERKNLFDISKYSNLEKMLRITVWVKRFIKILKKSDVSHGPITCEELLEAESYWLQIEQDNFFHEEVRSLKENNEVEKESTLYNFKPYLDENQILRLGGRLEFSDLSTEEKHPVILPKHSWLTTLIIRQEHEKLMHSGIACTLAQIRSRFWIPKGRQLVKSVIKKCLICRRYAAKHLDQISAPLPKDRISESPPFSVCGLDHAGPIYVKNGKETQKAYILLITCAVTRALHLELVNNMTTDAFLLAFRRFLARRGNCKIIYSDNAKSFKSAKQEMEKLYDVLSDKSLLNLFATKRIIWKNIVERAAWWGGFYERLVKSVKDCIRKILGKALLSYEEMSTLLVEVEAILNLRPLTYVYSESNEPNPLTPMHFLNFGKEITYPINFADIITGTSIRSHVLKRKRYQSLLLKQVWAKWKKQYLLDLKTAHSLKNPSSQAELEVGDIVLIEENTGNKFLWKLGRIERAIPGRDNYIRSYEVKTHNGPLRRTAQHLYPLELK